ncbi:DNA-binding protein [Pseudomonas sp. UMAB-40]|uniref:DNA-binding protein n=1 Tax=Pseudomonas sp. UMAB-40 TaxID=1365407 RepID=UPI001C57176B|nr:DNA-binding protein [Pseudomonas sp. UMAB-40]
MRPVEVTEVQIIAAGRQLIEEGRAVTANSLRRRIGGGNPRRLLIVWERAATGVAPPGADKPKSEPDPSVVTGTQTENPRVSVAELERRVQDLMAQLASAQRAAEIEIQRLELVVGAVTDQMNDYKQRCANYETSAKHTQIRIADLTARIDEQRSELNRGEKSRNALELALQKLQPIGTPPSK